MSTLDLSGAVEGLGKVKLLDGNLYDIVSPEQLGAADLQRIISRRRKAIEIMAKTDATEEDLDEMLSMLIDVCASIVPDAPREEIGRLGLPRMERLINHFTTASRVNGPGGTATEGTTSGD